MTGFRQPKTTAITSDALLGARPTVVIEVLRACRGCGGVNTGEPVCACGAPLSPPEPPIEVGSIMHGRSPAMLLARGAFAFGEALAKLAKRIDR